MNKKLKRNYNNNIMNQIISYIKNKNKKKRIFFYIQFIISIIVISFLSLYFFVEDENNNYDISKLSLNFKINDIYKSNQSDKYLGNLIIEKINLEYPIFSEYSEENLKLSICKFSGESLDENGNITILGHNYNGGFFWNLNKLETNDEIKIVSNGIEYKYNIFKIYETNNDDLEVLKPIYEDSKEITLVTCVKNSKKKRLVVKAIIKE